VPLFVCLSVALTVARGAAAQSVDPAAVVPRLIPYSGNLVDTSGKPKSGTFQVTFSLYENQGDVTPLWTETQSVTSVLGLFQVLIGNATPGGVPQSIFTGKLAHWLGMKLSGFPELPRMMFTSSPYTLKSSDADTLGGHPVTDFVLADGANTPAPKRAYSFTGTAQTEPSLISLTLAPAPPISVMSNAKVPNLNADLLDGLDSTDFLNADATLQANIDAEAATRSAADTTLQHNIDTETANRLAGDATLQGNIDTETAQRIAGDAAVQNNLNAETTQRIAGDAAVQSNLNTETTQRIAGDAAVQNNLNAETAQRIAGDAAVQNNLNLEIAARIQQGADGVALINNEVLARQNGDTTLQNALNSEIAASAHLAASNTYQGSGATVDTSIPQILGPVLHAAVLAASSSNPQDFVASAFDGTTKLDQRFRLQADPVGSSLHGRFSLLYAADGGVPAPIFSINSDGTLNWAPNQPLPPGAGDITSVSAGQGLSGGSASGDATLSLNLGFTDSRYTRPDVANTFGPTQHFNDSVLVGNTVQASNNLQALNSVLAGGAITAAGTVTGSSLLASGGGAIIGGSLAVTGTVAGATLTGGALISTGNVAAPTLSGGTGVFVANSTGSILGVTQNGPGGGIAANTSGTDVNATAIFGVASVGGTSAARGVVGSALGDTATGVAGTNTHATGTGIGVLASVTSPNATAALVQAPQNATAFLMKGINLAGTRIFHVDGTGNFVSRGSYSTNATGDFAEGVDTVADPSTYEPGDVLVIDGSGAIDKVAEAYSTRVAGVYSTAPALLARAPDPDDPQSAMRIPLAVVGIVPCKVSAENGAIQPGDLLVTASTPGYAMKGTDRSLMLGAVVGKALEALADGSGVIRVLVTLQ
jgi:hypothetical protein